MLSREKKDQVVIDLAKCIVKNKIDEKFAKEVDFIKGEVDFSLMRQWGRMSKHMKPWIWLSAHSVQCSFCMDTVLLEAVIASKGNWSTVMGQLKTICFTPWTEHVFILPGLDQQRGIPQGDHRPHW